MSVFDSLLGHITQSPDRFHAHARLLLLWGTSGFFIQEAHTSDVRVSSGIHVFTSFKTVLARLAIGDPLSLSLSGNVADFRSSSDPSFLFAIELDDPTGIVVHSQGTPSRRLRSGSTGPPTQALSGPDAGVDRCSSVPNNVTQLGTVKNAIVAGLNDSFGELWRVECHWEEQSRGLVPNVRYDSPKFSLVPGSPAGGSLDGTDPKADSDGAITLTFNPGGTELTNAAWDGSRKPLVGHWEAQSVVRLFTINVYLTGTLGGTSARDDPQPPEEDVDKRTRQIEVVAASDANFVQSMLDKDEDTNIVVAGDHNVPKVERYTYLFDQNAEQLDHAAMEIVDTGDTRDAM
ncbi:hypothetical protein DICSQDRAFT_179195 [Dichomitus squalens LYAD-421 SS1]|uniref:uncharacterized protein n=1 Tax=Dichomitus squalens (strain LYAD-421) TaxID=732165 RepID=UPI0004412AC3|nr:uncharacterized protein DICSQDRAFT_179195 [Dichomitus squalens LYAD-421 SS1]EJF63170.1 hypothetical protein DICSQDRAFT_179195 [Dichomitus squalens LYAD-421 SS1]